MHASKPTTLSLRLGLGLPLSLWMGLGLAAGCGEDKDYDDDGAAETSDSASEDSGGGSGSGGGGGGVAADEFVQRYTQAMCAWAQDCGVLQGFGGTYAACLDLVAGQVEGSLSDCSYDPVAAEECLSELDAMGCEGGSQNPACDAVCGDGA